MNCQNCGQPLPLNAQFCGNCGAQTPAAPASGPQQTTAPAAPQAPVIQQQATSQSIPPSPVIPPPPPTPQPMQLDEHPPQSPSGPTVQPQSPTMAQPSSLPPSAPMPGQAAPAQPVVPAFRPGEIPGSVRNLAWAASIVGGLYILASIAKYLIEYNETGDPSNLAFMPVDIFLGLLILVPGILMFKEKSTKKLLTYVKTAGIVTGILVLLSLMAGGSAGILVLLVIYFAYRAHSDLKQTPQT